MSCQALLYWMAQNNRVAYHCAVAAAALVAGCDSLTATKHETGSGTTVSIHFDRAEFERQREAYRREMQLRIAKFESQLGDLSQKADDATGDAKVRLQKELAEQRINLDRAKEELKQLDAVVGEKWAEFERRSSAAFDDMQKGFERALSHFSK